MKEIIEALDKAMPAITRRMQNELVLACPVDQGRLRNSIKVIQNDRGLIIWMADYGKYVEFGTPPHIIRPKNKQALKFEVGKKERLGQKGRKKNEVFAKEVRHPGTRPNPFVRNTIMIKLKQIIIEEINNNL